MSNPQGAIEALGLGGWIPLRHHDPEAGVAGRHVRYGAVVEHLDEFRSPIRVEGESWDNRADWSGWVRVKSADRTLRPLSILSPAVSSTVSSTSTVPPTQQAQPGFPPPKTRARAQGGGGLLPLRAPENPDDRFKETPLRLGVTPPGFKGFPAGWTGHFSATTEEFSQIEVFHPDFLGLVCVNYAGDPALGTWVYDLDTSSQLHTVRRAQLQSAWSVVDLTPGAPGCGLSGRAIGWNVGRGGNLDGGAGFGLMVDHDRAEIHAMPSALGGILAPAGGCQHPHGADADGRGIYPAHLTTNAYVLAPWGSDGPWAFQSAPWQEPEADHGLWRRAHIRFNPAHLHRNGCTSGAGAWEVEVKQAIVIIEKPWGDPPPEDPPPLPPEGDLFPPPPGGGRPLSGGGTGRPVTGGGGITTGGGAGLPGSDNTGTSTPLPTSGAGEWVTGGSVADGSLVALPGWLVHGGPPPLPPGSDTQAPPRPVTGGGGGGGSEIDLIAGGVGPGAITTAPGLPLPLGPPTGGRPVTGGGGSEIDLISGGVGPGAITTAPGLPLPLGPPPGMDQDEAEPEPPRPPKNSDPEGSFDPLFGFSPQYLFGPAFGFLGGNTDPEAPNIGVGDPECFAELLPCTPTVGMFIGIPFGDGTQCGADTTKTADGTLVSSGTAVVTPVGPNLSTLAGGTYDPCRDAGTLGRTFSLMFPGGLSSIEFGHPDQTSPTLAKGGGSIQQNAAGTGISIAPRATTGERSTSTYIDVTDAGGVNVVGTLLNNGSPIGSAGGNQGIGGSGEDGAIALVDDHQYGAEVNATSWSLVSGKTAYPALNCPLWIKFLSSFTLNGALDGEGRGYLEPA